MKKVNEAKIEKVISNQITTEHATHENVDVVAAVNTKIEELIKRKEEKISEIKSQIKEAEENIKKATEEKIQATKNSDLKRFAGAKAKEEEAKNSLEMYTELLNMTESESAYVTNSESDEVITNLLSHEKYLDNKYLGDILPLIDELERVTKKYQENIAGAEITIKKWTDNIHANYRSEHAVYNRNGIRTSISEKPVPVHDTPYTGTIQGTIIKEFIKNIRKKIS